MLSILDHLLPGVRKVRLPLLSGAAIVITAWIWWPGVDTREEIALRPTDDPIRRFIDLWEAVPSTLQGALALAIAYLVGSLWTQITYPFAERFMSRFRRNAFVVGNVPRSPQPDDGVAITASKESLDVERTAASPDRLAEVLTEAQLAKERIWLAAFDELHLRFALSFPLVLLGLAISFWVALVLAAVFLLWMALIVLNTGSAAKLEEERVRRDPDALASRQRDLQRQSLQSSAAERDGAPTQEITGTAAAKFGTTFPESSVEARAETATAAGTAYDATVESEDGVARPEPITPDVEVDADAEADEDDEDEDNDEDDSRS